MSAVFTNPDAGTPEACESRRLRLIAARAQQAPAPSREVRLLTSKDIADVRETLWRDAQMNLSDLHAEDAAKAFQCKFCEVNGLTVKDQS